MQRRGRRPIGGLSSPVPERMEDTAETSHRIVKHQSALKRFRNYCGPIKVARSGFLWEKTTKGDVAPPDFLRAALTEGNHVRLSSRKAACSSMAPPSSTGNPGSVYTNCETAVATFIVAAVIVPGMTRIVGNPETTTESGAERRKFRLAGDTAGTRRARSRLERADSPRRDGNRRILIGATTSCVQY
jgi:hypothetical protein